MRRKGCNLVVADFFDAGLLGDHFVYMLETAKRNVLQVPLDPPRAHSPQSMHGPV